MHKMCTEIQLTIMFKVKDKLEVRIKNVSKTKRNKQKKNTLMLFIHSYRVFICSQIHYACGTRYKMIGKQRCPL